MQYFLVSFAWTLHRVWGTGNLSIYKDYNIQQTVGTDETTESAPFCNIRVFSRKAIYELRSWANDLARRPHVWADPEEALHIHSQPSGDSCTKQHRFIGPKFFDERLEEYSNHKNASTNVTDLEGTLETQNL